MSQLNFANKNKERETDRDKKYHYMRVDPQNTRIFFWRVGILSYRLPPARWCSWNPSVSVYQLLLLWEAVFSFSEIFLKILSKLLPISWWVITSSPAHPTLSVQQFLMKDGMTPMLHPPCSSSLTPSDVSGCFPRWNTFSNILLMWKWRNKKLQKH